MKRKLWILVLALCLSPAIPAGASEVAEAAIVAPSPEAELEKKLSQVITLEYKDAELPNVLRSMAWTHGLNIVTGPDVKGNATINLTNVTVREALNAILTANGLVSSTRGGVIYVSVGEKEDFEITAEVFRLKYLSASEAQNLLRPAMSPKGEMKINEADNSVVLSDYASNIAKVRALLSKVDRAPQQVLIEAKIVDITSSDLKAMGVKWDFDYDPVSGGIFKRSTSFDEKLKATVNMEEQSSSLTGGQLVLNALTLSGLKITATLDALVRDGKAHLLASPSIAVINGQEARIVIGERFPYKERTQTTSGTTETTRFVDIGTTLRVRPFINDDGYITLNVHPEVSSLLASLDAGPRITTREADTTVRIREGETLVIGGLISQKDNSSRDKVPILGDIPIIGAIFSRRESEGEQKELAVFITPRTLASSRREDELLREEKSRTETKLASASLSSQTFSEKTGSLGLVEQIYEKAIALDEGRGLASIRKGDDHRKAQAISLYEHIWLEFPDSPRAPESLYRLAKIHYDLGGHAKAKELLSRLVADYPQSVWVSKARQKLEAKNAPQEKKKRKP